MSYQTLINSLVQKGVLKNQRVIDAFETVERKYFLPEDQKDMDDVDSALPIGNDQTISQPTTVAFMTELLDPRPGQNILEIGYGSGWQTAILAEIINKEEIIDKEDSINQKDTPTKEDSTKENTAQINAYEIVPEVAEFGRQNIRNFYTNTENKTEQIPPNIHLHQEDYLRSLHQNAPYDRIISAAAFDKDPEELFEALAPNGVMVYPTQSQDIRRVTRSDDGTDSNNKKFTEETYPGFMFVPITHR